MLDEKLKFGWQREKQGLGRSRVSSRFPATAGTTPDFAGP